MDGEPITQRSSLAAAAHIYLRPEMWGASPAPVVARDMAPPGPVWRVSPPSFVDDCDATPPAVLMIGVVVADTL